MSQWVAMSPRRDLTDLVGMGPMELVRAPAPRHYRRMVRVTSGAASLEALKPHS